MWCVCLLLLACAPPGHRRVRGESSGLRGPRGCRSGRWFIAKKGHFPKIQKKNIKIIKRPTEDCALSYTSPYLPLWLLQMVWSLSLPSRQHSVYLAATAIIQLPITPIAQHCDSNSPVPYPSYRSAVGISIAVYTT